jgi:PIN domain nuclease of toxin-antitoxin system
MKYLVDTHVLLWSFFEPELLSPTISKIIMDVNNFIYYSPINLWEISIKYGLKKMNLRGVTPENFYKEVENSYYICKEINKDDFITNYRLPRYHKDPFDRFLIWEAIRNDFTLMSVDKKMKLYKKEGLNIIY